MTGTATRDRPGAGQVRRGIAMTTETEVVKTRFRPDPNRRAAAAMTADAGLRAAPIDVVVMTLNALHGAVFVVGKVYGEPFSAAQERLAHRHSHATMQQSKQGDERAEDDTEDESRMPPEHEPGGERRRRPG